MAAEESGPRPVLNAAGTRDCGPEQRSDDLQRPAREPAPATAACGPAHPGQDVPEAGTVMLTAARGAVRCEEREWTRQLRPPCERETTFMEVRRIRTFKDVRGRS